MDAKAISKSVSLPASLWAAIDAHAESTGTDRSGYFRALAEGDLSAAGKLPTAAVTRARQVFEDLLAASGPEVITAALERHAAAIVTAA